MIEKRQKLKIEDVYLYENKQDMLFFTYDTQHPKRIDIEEFYIGKFRLFRKDKIYSAEFKSKPYLNPSLTWNQESFELLIKRLNEFVIETESVDFIEWVFLSLYIKAKGRQINLLKIKMNEQYGIDPQQELWAQFLKYNIFKSKLFDQIFNTIDNLRVQIQVSLQRVQKTQNEENSKVEKVKKKLSALMYEKQKKIMELTGNNTYKWTPGLQDNQNLSLDPIQNNYFLSQEDNIMIGSLFAPSQEFLL